MNYKKKKYKYNKGKVLSMSLRGWSYGGQIAKEVVSRQEFKKEIREYMRE